MKVFVDFVSTTKIQGNVAKYTGGTNYAKYMANALYDYIEDKKQINILLPKGCEISDEDTFFNPFQIERIDSLVNVGYNQGDILYLPQVNGSLLTQLPKIKKRFPYLKIYGTLHDRQHNIVKFDSYDTIFEDGIKRQVLVLWIYYFIKRLIFNIIYNHCVKALDKVFTVSNYSMQLLSTSAVKSIKYYVQGTYLKNKVQGSRGDYVLFVGGNRGEKNLLRALLAFRKYKSTNNDSLKFIATGISSNLEKKLSRIVELNDDVVLKQYVSDEELSILYSNCRFVVFISKAEGYGCPIREAMQYGKVVLASRTTSVPEVAGAAIYYVDPLSVDSIVKGYIYLADDEHLDRYEEFVARRNNIVNEVAKQDLSIFMNDFFE